MFTKLDLYGPFIVIVCQRFRFVFIWKPLLPTLPLAKGGIPYNDFKHKIKHYIPSTWLDDWNGAVANKLHSVRPVLAYWQTSYKQEG